MNQACLYFIYIIININIQLYRPLKLHVCLSNKVKHTYQLFQVHFHGLIASWKAGFPQLC